MTLALETGWTPSVLVDLPDRFRRACHWALFVRAIVGSDGMPQVPKITPGLPTADKAEIQRVRAAISQLRTAIYPEDD